MNISQSQPEEAPDTNWKALWKLKLHDRSKFLIWRIATGILPTKANLAARLGYGDIQCCLCQEESETLDHLFFSCPTARAIWFGSSWALRSDLLTFNSYQDIAKFICEPPIAANTSPSDKELCVQTSIQFALTLDCIWNLRNQVLHNNSQVNILNIVRSLETRISEHLHSLKELDHLNGVDNFSWEPSTEEFIKINVDAAVSHDRAYLAAIARDHTGYIVNVWAKKTNHLDPAIAEVAAITWALALVRDERCENVIVESDARNCINDLSCPPDATSWSYSALSSQTLNIVSYFLSCSFLWVRRDTNQTAHALAKVAFSLSLPFLSFQDSLPPSVKEVWLRDLFRFPS